MKTAAGACGASMLLLVCAGSAHAVEPYEVGQAAGRYLAAYELLHALTETQCGPLLPEIPGEDAVFQQFLVLVPTIGQADVARETKARLDASVPDMVRRFDDALAKMTRTTNLRSACATLYNHLRLDWITAFNDLKNVKAQVQQDLRETLRGR